MIQIEIKSSAKIINYLFDNIFQKEHYCDSHFSLFSLFINLKLFDIKTKQL